VISESTLAKKRRADIDHSGFQRGEGGKERKRGRFRRRLLVEESRKKKREGAKIDLEKRNPPPSFPIHEEKREGSDRLLSCFAEALRKQAPERGGGEKRMVLLCHADEKKTALRHVEREKRRVHSSSGFPTVG